jgi:hypothetical protein
MNDASNTASDDIQADEEILISTVSDEALEAAAGAERGGPQHCYTTVPPTQPMYICSC